TELAERISSNPIVVRVAVAASIRARSRLADLARLRTGVACTNRSPAWVASANANLRPERRGRSGEPIAALGVVREHVPARAGRCEQDDATWRGQLCTERYGFLDRARASHPGSAERFGDLVLRLPYGDDR